MIAINIVIASVFSLSILLLLVGLIIFKRICIRSKSRRKSFEEQFSEYRLSLATEQRLRNDFEWFDAHRSQEICAISHDGLRLFATVINAPDKVTPKGVIILFHGYRSNARRDFCMHAKILHDAGYHLIVTDQRSHERSEGKYICYGVKERFDVVVWKNKATKIFGPDIPIALMGLSMGGATVLMASELISKEDTSVKCIVADCPFSSPKDIISYVMKTYNKIPFSNFWVAFASFWSRTFAGFSLSAPSAAEIYAKSHLPALLFHGTCDDYVPIHHSKAVVDAAKGKATLITVEGAKHAEAIYYDEHKYTESLLEFLSKNMK